MNYYSAIKRNKLITRATTWMDLKGVMAKRKSQTPKGSILYDSIYIPLSKWQNDWDGEQDSGCYRLDGEEEGAVWL